MGIFKTERSIINGKRMKRCTGSCGDPCPKNAWIEDIRRKVQCKECRRKSAKVWRVNNVKRSKPDFRYCTPQEIEALNTGNVELLLKCEPKGDRWGKECAG